LIGAVLIKNYASLDKNENKFHVIFLKIAPYQSTTKILYVLKGTKEESKTALPKGTYDKREPLPLLSNSLFIKIDPCGIEFAMMIPCHHGFGNVVAWGLNLCM
jgi:hypothetical protein